MIYISKEDLITLSIERFIDESSEQDSSILDDIELKQIALVKSYIASRYNVNLIFDTIEPIRDEILVNILSCFVLHGVIRRNAARKIPTDIKEEYDKAMSTLEKIATGRITLHGIPLPIDETGNTLDSNSLWGNNTNEDFYI